MLQFTLPFDFHVLGLEVVFDMLLELNLHVLLTLIYSLYGMLLTYKSACFLLLHPISYH